MPLKTDRLILRQLALTDATTMQRLAGDWEVAQWTAQVPFPYEIRMAREFVDWSLAEFPLGRNLVFAMVERVSGELVGVISLTVRARIEGELGYWVGVPYQRRGYASEAAARLLQLAFEDLDIAQVTAACRPENEASWRVMQACGMTRIGEIERWAEARKQNFRLVRYGINREGVASQD
jgi:RimJ/RimL family protein N-acetyltransferase